MNIAFALCLPRDEASVPMVRHLCRGALSKLGVNETCVSDIEIAVTEACSNVLHHAAGTSNEYEVSVDITNTSCEIRVVDTGGGFNHTKQGGGVSDSAESGRGIYLMRSLVDLLEFGSLPDHGTEVHLIKKLVLDADAPLAALSGGRAGNQAS
jgi:serine/threonine-protein kinase RsbW